MGFPKDRKGKKKTGKKLKGGLTGLVDDVLNVVKGHKKRVMDKGKEEVDFDEHSRTSFLIEYDHHDLVVEHHPPRLRKRPWQKLRSSDGTVVEGMVLDSAKGEGQDSDSDLDYGY
jgi:hypothetical protein